LNATIPFEWKTKPMEIKLSEAMFDRVRVRWEEYELELKD
jgi:hypothetical protein